MSSPKPYLQLILDLYLFDWQAQLENADPERRLVKRKVSVR